MCYWTNTGIISIRGVNILNDVQHKKSFTTGKWGQSQWECYKFHGSPGLSVFLDEVWGFIQTYCHI